MGLSLKQTSLRKLIKICILLHFFFKCSVCAVLLPGSDSNMHCHGHLVCVHINTYSLTYFYCVKCKCKGLLTWWLFPFRNIHPISAAEIFKISYFLRFLRIYKCGLAPLNGANPCPICRHRIRGQTAVKPYCIK